MGNMDFLFIPAILMTAFLIEAIFGFGGGLVAIPLLSLIIAPSDAVLMMLLFQTLKGVLIFGCWKLVRQAYLSLLPAGILVGVLIGSFLMKAISPDVLRIFMATYILAFVAQDAWKFGSITRLHGRAYSFLTGLFGGAVQGIIGTGGPALVTYFRSLGLEKEVFRAHVIVALFIANIPRFLIDIDYIASNRTILSHIIPAMLCFAAAMTIGSRVPQFIKEETFRKILRLLLVIAALSLYVKILV